jgi:hypothetical protein
MIHVGLFALFVVLFFFNMKRNRREEHISWKRALLWHLSQLVSIVFFFAVGHISAEVLPEKVEYFGIFFAGALWLTTSDILDTLWKRPPKRKHTIDFTEDGELKIITWTASEQVCSSPSEAYNKLSGSGLTKEQVGHLFLVAHETRVTRYGMSEAENTKFSQEATTGLSREDEPNQ